MFILISRVTTLIRPDFNPCFQPHPKEEVAYKMDESQPWYIPSRRARDAKFGSESQSFLAFVYAAFEYHKDIEHDHMSQADTLHSEGISIGKRQLRSVQV